MKKATKIVIASGLVLASVSAIGMKAYADKKGDGDCGWKRGGHHGAMMRGMHHPGAMGLFGMKMGEDRNYSADQIRTLSEAFLLRLGNENLKVGDITETDKESYLVQVVTKDGSLVKEVEVSRKNGMPVGMMQRHAKQLQQEEKEVESQ